MIPKTKNPKLVGSNILDCIPHTGRCPQDCPECYYNSGFYRPLVPLIPTLEEAEGKIIRVSSGHDSNLQKDLVLQTTEKYKDKFYNTSIADFDFPSGVVWTANSKHYNSVIMLGNRYPNIKNLIAVRFRTVPWNFSLARDVVRHYKRLNIPVILTFMRFRNLETIPQEYRDWYELKMHIVSAWWTLSLRSKEVTNFAECNLTCGLKHKLCLNCRNCEKLYKILRERRNES